MRNFGWGQRAGHGRGWLDDKMDKAGGAGERRCNEANFWQRGESRIHDSGGSNLGRDWASELESEDGLNSRGERE